MQTEADWQAWFLSYRTFILHYARLAEKNGMDGLCVGMELHRTAVEREADWRELIEAVRAVYRGKLVYAANWGEEFKSIPFWDALDYIGIQAYFPLTEKSHPSVTDLMAGWIPHVEAMERVQKRFGKPVIFTEIGYRSSVNTAIRPWEWRSSSTGATDRDDLETQVRCYEAFFRTFWEKDWLAGMYLWKWFPNSRDAGGVFDKNFTPQNKPAEGVMRTWYGKAGDDF